MDKVDIFTVPLGFDRCYVLKGDGVIVIDAGQPERRETCVTGR